MKIVVALSLASLLATGCFLDSDSTTPPPVVVTPPPVSKVSFVEFARQAFAQDADDEPLKVDESQLEFDADDDPAAFDDLIVVPGA